MGVVSGTCFICALVFSLSLRQAAEEQLETTTERSEVRDPDVRGWEERKGPRGNDKIDKEDESARMLQFWVIKS